jgi:hypothetical protein
MGAYRPSGLAMSIVKQTESAKIFDSKYKGATDVLLRLAGTSNAPLAHMSHSHRAIVEKICDVVCGASLGPPYQDRSTPLPHTSGPHKRV